jgi:hypothetical protein
MAVSAATARAHRSMGTIGEFFLRRWARFADNFVVAKGVICIPEFNREEDQSRQTTRSKYITLDQRKNLLVAYWARPRSTGVQTDED